MIELFRGRFRVKATRLIGHDYSSPGYYFITICTKGKEHSLAKIENGMLILSETGRMVNNFSSKIPNHFPNIELDEHIIMPNHIHLILKITKSASPEKNYHIKIIN